MLRFVQSKRLSSRPLVGCTKVQAGHCCANPHRPNGRDCIVDAQTDGCDPSTRLQPNAGSLLRFRGHKQGGCRGWMPRNRAAAGSPDGLAPHGGAAARSPSSSAAQKEAEVGQGIEQMPQLNPDCLQVVTDSVTTNPDFGSGFANGNWQAGRPSRSLHRHWSDQIELLVWRGAICYLPVRSMAPLALPIRQTGAAFAPLAGNGPTAPLICATSR